MVRATILAILLCFSTGCTKLLSTVIPIPPFKLLDKIVSKTDTTSDYVNPEPAALGQSYCCERSTCLDAESLEAQARDYAEKHGDPRRRDNEDFQQQNERLANAALANELAKASQARDAAKLLDLAAKAGASAEEIEKATGSGIDFCEAEAESDPLCVNKTVLSCS